MFLPLVFLGVVKIDWSFKDLTDFDLVVYAFILYNG